MIRGSRTRHTPLASSTTCWPAAIGVFRSMPASHSWKNRRSTPGSRRDSRVYSAPGCRCMTARVWPAHSSWRAACVIGAVALFAGSMGVLKHSHDLFTDTGLMCGAAMGLYGLLRIACVLQAASRHARLWPGALWFGLGAGLCWMTKGVFVPLVFGATALLLPVALNACRSRRYAYALALAFIAGAPFMLIWPIWLAYHAWPLFVSWF